MSRERLCRIAHAHANTAAMPKKVQHANVCDKTDKVGSRKDDVEMGRDENRYDCLGCCAGNACFGRRAWGERLV